MRIIRKILLLCVLLFAVDGIYAQLFNSVTGVESKAGTAQLEFKSTTAHKGVSISSKQQYIEVTRRGKTHKINPTPPPQASMYIWVTLSPNGKYILYNVPLKGTFVCNLKGKIVAELGRLNAPVWYDNRIVIGMDDYDDGNNFTKSDVVAVDIRSLERQIISTDLVSVYPYPEKPFVHYFTMNKLITIKLK